MALSCPRCIQELESFLTLPAHQIFFAQPFWLKIKPGSRLKGSEPPVARAPLSGVADGTVRLTSRGTGFATERGLRSALRVSYGFYQVLRKLAVKQGEVKGELYGIDNGARA